MSERDERHADQGLEEALREWDPAARLPEPSAEELHAARARLHRAALERELQAVPGRRVQMRWAVATAGALALVAALLVLRPRDPAPQLAASTASTESVQMQLTASNGVRIYWSVQLSNGTGD